MKRMITLCMLMLISLVLPLTLSGCQSPTRTAEEHNGLGIALIDDGQYEQAIEEFNQAIELDPNCATAYNNRAYAYIRKGQWDLAIADCNKAIELDPNQAAPYNNRAHAYSYKG